MLQKSWQLVLKAAIYPKVILCELFIQKDINKLEELMKQAVLLTGSEKEICRQFRIITEQIMGA